MLPHRSDTSRGHLHPSTRLRLTLPPSFPCRFSFSFRAPSRSRSRTIRVVSPVRPLMPPLSWGRLREHLSSRHHPGFATTGTPSQQFPPLVAFRSPMQRPLSTRQIFSPPSETTYSAPVAGSMTVVYTIFGTSDRTIGELLRRRHARKESSRPSGARERRSREICSPACDIRASIRSAHVH